MSIAVCGLFASIGSCVAGWEAWRTSRAAERIARAQFDVGGGQITIGPNLWGDASPCTGGKSVFPIEVEVHNTGRLATQVRLVVKVDVSGPDGDSGTFGSDQVAGAFFNDAAAVPALSTSMVTVQMSCELITYIDRRTTIRYDTGGGPVQSLPMPDESLRIFCPVPEKGSYQRQC
ncbi:hypothetical protein ACFXG4_19690 [Nocardia sp. NPDC059246]|uniref:hypothetical protein n=1 Tax=unclassified Nocardia TaxID=2637762 RepID=UPI0036959ADE